jgi:hypothetical protein
MMTITCLIGELVLASPELATDSVVRDATGKGTGRVGSGAELHPAATNDAATVQRPVRVRISTSLRN